jgi:serine/threonine protein kinase
LKGDNFHGQTSDSFHNEREAMLRLRGHPHVIQVLDNAANSITVGGQRYQALTLEVASHGDVLPYIQLRSFGEILARTYFKQLMSALRAAHSLGVYHRDVKLENILLSSNYTLKLGDFGHAHVNTAVPDIGYRCAESSAPLPKRPRANTEPEPFVRGFCGSPGYVAPEISKTSDYLGSAADIWSAGCVLFAMLVGYSAFEMRCPDNRCDDPWLRLVFEGKYDFFWQNHMKFGNVVVSNYAMGK